MRIRTGKVLPTPGLVFALAMHGVAIGQPIVATDEAPAAGGAALIRAEADRRQDEWRGPVVTLKGEESARNGAMSLASVAEIVAAQPDGTTKDFALALSSLGMLGMISVLRLTRGTPTRTSI